MKNTFKVGDAVVVKLSDGASVSGTIRYVTRAEVYVTYYPEYANPCSVYVERRDWATRITPFGNEKFMAL